MNNAASNVTIRVVMIRNHFLRLITSSKVRSSMVVHSFLMDYNASLLEET